MNNDYTIILNKKCNKKCSFCHQEHTGEEISNESILEFLKKISYNQKKIYLTLFGGEPLLSKEKIKYINDSIYANKIDLLIYSNCDFLEIKDIEYMNNFKKVSIETELNVFGDYLFFKDKKYEIINFFITTAINIRTHTIISKENVNKIIYFLPFIKKHYDKLEKIDFKFEIMFPTENEFDELEFLNIIKFVQEIEDQFLSNNLLKIKYLFNYTHNYNYYNCTNCNIFINKELTLNANGVEIPCRRFSNHCYTNVEINEIEKEHLECEKCYFNNICEECKYSYYGISNKKMKCNRMKKILKAYQLFHVKQCQIEKIKSYNLSIILGNKCNKNCYFCQRDMDIKEMDIEKIKHFLKNNYYRIESLDTLIGGEPLLYLNEKFEFLNNFFSEINIISNLLIENEFVKKNKNYRITASIQDCLYKKMKWEYYKGSIDNVLVLLNDEVIDEFDDIILFLYKHKINFNFIELFSYKGNNFELNSKNKIKLSKIKKLYKNYFVDKNNINYKECFNTKLNLIDNKLTICNSIYEPMSLIGEKNIGIISDKIDQYIIKSEEIEEVCKNIYKKYNFKNKKKCISTYFLNSK